MKIIILSLVLLAGCAQVTSLNMKKHQFGILPTKVIWFQVAGLEEEQIAMLRFNKPGEVRTSFENSMCIGKAWGYDLYNLRATPQATFLAQLTGKKNIKATCEDAEHRPIWSYVSGSGYGTGIIENGADDQQSLVSMNQCGEKGLVFLSSLYFWIRKQPAAGDLSYSFAEPIPTEPNQLAFDRTCRGGVCTSSLYDNFEAIYSRFRLTSRKHLMIVRDFSYSRALENNKMADAKMILEDIERTYAYAQALAADSGDYLVLLTTASSKYVELPAQGKSWYDFEKKQAGASVKKPSMLTNLVLASGARSENFCGMYESSQIFERILSGPKQQGLEFKVINPFK